MRKTILLSILLCASATLAQAGNIVPYTAPPISMPTPATPGATLSTPGLTPLQRSEVQVRDMLEQNRRRNLQNQMSQTTQQQQENTRQMEQSGQAIGEGLEHLAHACDPDVLRRPGLHLLSRMGLCDQHRAEAVAQERVAGPTTQRRYEVATQPREVPPMHNGPMSVYDRPYPYYRGD